MKKTNKLISWGLGVVAGVAAFMGPKQDANAQIVTHSINCYKGKPVSTILELQENAPDGTKTTFLRMEYPQNYGLISKSDGKPPTVIMNTGESNYNTFFDIDKKPIPENDKQIFMEAYNLFFTHAEQVCALKVPTFGDKKLSNSFKFQKSSREGIDKTKTILETAVKYHNP
jgi:hypothetical protein